jgi:hypothetical protein
MLAIQVCLGCLGYQNRRLMSEEVQGRSNEQEIKLLLITQFRTIAGLFQHEIMVRPANRDMLWNAPKRLLQLGYCYRSYRCRQIMFLKTTIFKEKRHLRFHNLTHAEADMPVERF